MKGKKLLALCLSVIMLLSVFSIAAYAEFNPNLGEPQVKEDVKWVFPYLDMTDEYKALKIGDKGSFQLVNLLGSHIPEKNSRFTSFEKSNPKLSDTYNLFTIYLDKYLTVEESTGALTDKRTATEYDNAYTFGFIFDEGARNEPELSANPNAVNNDYFFKFDSSNYTYSVTDYGYGYWYCNTSFSDRLVDFLRETYPNAKIYGYDETSEIAWEGMPLNYVTIEVYANVYRLYNPNSGEHFFTVNKEESDWLTSLGWKYEGIAWYAPGKKEKPVYRVYNPNAGDHHYTLDAAEKDWLVSLGWKDEGIAFYSPEQGGTAINRVYNPNAVAGSHFFTQNTGEYNYLDSIGWTAEGTAFYGYQ